MPDPFSVSAHERGVVRIFTTSLEPDGNAAVTPENVQRLLGNGLDLNPSSIEVFPTTRLEPMSLSEYLHEGYGITRADLDGKSSALDSLKGLIILVSSSAFKGKAAALDPKGGVRFVGAFQEPVMEPPKPMSPAEGIGPVLQPQGTATPPAPGKRPGSIAILAALVLAAAIILFLVT